MFKNVTYAYPTSTYAARFDRSAQGCYVVEIAPDWRKGAASNVRGPFDSLADALNHAEVIQCAYAPYSLRCKDMARHG
ncbi:hypothetical protein RZS08_28210 [Arthrospira platensis SPKY1]|nr:hypothetical protein [Arthrospira platensis SPKY1]